MWTYQESTGELKHDGKFVFKGYSGHGEGQNNPAYQQIHNVGPIPRGTWTIQGPPFDTPTHGPYVLRLVPCSDTDTFGRSGFLMHGDKIGAPGTASLGCIIMPRAVREQVWNSDDHYLEVVA